MTNRVLILASWAALAALPVLADENLKPPVGSVSTQSADFAPGGTIRVDGSYDDLYIEGWDRARVEVTAVKFLPYEFDPAHPQHAAQNLEKVGVDLERKSPTEMAITTSLPPRKGLLTHFPFYSKTEHVRIEYHVYVPHDSKLVIHHGVGLVSVTGIKGDIEATCHRGDIVLWLQPSEKYSVDAKNKLGKISSDFEGSSVARFLVGQKFTGSETGAPYRLFLRMGFGGITLKPILPESEATENFLARSGK
jgi:hypothetical protein